MKHLKILALLFTTFFLFSCGNTGKILSTANEVYKTLNVGITQDEAANGLNATYKILFPPEAQKVEQTLRSVGLGNMCDKAIESINRGAEMAVAEAKPVFVNAISAMTISDAINIVTGGNGAGTSYLKRTTSDQLKVKFSPIIQQSLDKVGATRYWTDAITAYNKIPTVQKINPDLNAYLTNKAMEALFNQIELEENKIRQDPLKRTSELLKKVFNHADTQKSK